MFNYIETVSTSLRINKLVYFNIEKCFESKFISYTRKEKNNNFKWLWRVSKLRRGIFYNTQEEEREYLNECRCFAFILEFFIEAVFGKVVYQLLRSLLHHREWHIVQYSPTLDITFVFLLSACIQRVVNVKIDDEFST